MKARFIGQGAFKRGYSGQLKDGRTQLKVGDVVEGQDAERLLDHFPRDFEPIGETVADNLKIGVHRMVHPGKYPKRTRKTSGRKRGRPKKTKTQGDDPAGAGESQDAGSGS